MKNRFVAFDGRGGYDSGPSTSRVFGTLFRHTERLTHLPTTIFAAFIVLLFVGCGRSNIPAVQDQVEQDPVVNHPVDDVTSQGRSKGAKRSGTIDIPQFLEDAAQGKTDLVRLAIEAGVDVNASDEEQRTALQFASFDGHQEIVELLLQEGASPDQRDSMGRTALMYASTGSSVETVKLLIVAGADVNAADSVEHFTALMFAAAEGQAGIVKLLQEHSADPSLVDIDGDNALTFATQNGHTEVMKLLAE